MDVFAKHDFRDDDLKEDSGEAIGNLDKGMSILLLKGPQILAASK